MSKEKLSKIFCVVVGVVFLLSGIGKMIDARQFADLITNYGFYLFSSLAPVIIIAEVFIGLCLMFNFHRKLFSIIAFITLVIFSTAYFYASTVKGITNCGCFGTIKILEFSPAAVYIRNIVLLGMLLLSCIYLPREDKMLFSLRQYTFLFTLLVVSFYAGYTFQGKKKEKLQKHPLIEKPVKETILPQYYNFSPDSTYVICIFSYRCSNCWNYMENLNRYKESSKIDHVIAFSAGEDTGNEFAEFFNPTFEIKSVNEEEISAFTPFSPTVPYIQKDTIRHVVQGIVPSVYRLEKDYLSN